MAKETYPSPARGPAHDRKKGPFDEYEVEQSCDTLVRADRIRSNPALMAACRKHAAEEAAVMKKATNRGSKP